MRVSVVLPQFFLPQNSVRLGRLTTSVDHSHQGYHDPPAASPPPMLTSLHASYTGEQHTSSTSGFGSTLTSLLSAGFSKRAKMKIRVTTEDAFDRGQDVYMVVGFHTVTNATVTHESLAGSSVGGQITVTVGLSLAAAGVVVRLGSAVDPSATVYQQGYDRAQSQFGAPGEHICAVQYRKICHVALEQACLSEVRQWPSMERARNEEDGEDDIVEVDLTDVQDLEGIWDKKTLDDEALFLRSFDES
ncbi:hypothetical protein GE09DRAFT_1248163 [Coniochaeta sp. 2T2.1]|nr:hypothetical protein GE09DRAFT_1248163 [Coniochaeta sp. 2T2.1]